MRENDAQAGTLGAHLDNAARHLAARHLVAYAWASGLAPVLERAAELTETLQDRFDRFEQDEPSADRPAEPAAMYDVPGRGRARTAPSAARPPSGTGPAAANIIQAAAEDAGQPLPSDVRARLREVAGPGADALRVHHDNAADITARAYRADAVTTGRDLHLRGGRFRPDEPAGFALLAHEAAHVTALLGQGGAARRAAAGGMRAEEDAALAREQAARDLFDEAAQLPAGPAPHHAAPTDLPFPPGPASAAAPAQAAPAAPAAHPVTAPADRNLPQQPPFDIEDLRRTLISDLMRQLRTEFERGG